MGHKRAVLAMAAWLSILAGLGTPVLAADSVGPDPTTDASPAPVPPAWPRTFTNGDDTAVMYQPQIDSWDDFSRIKFRAAIALTTDSTSPVQYGVLAGEADTIVDHDARMVIMANFDMDVRFLGLSDAQESDLKKLALACLPKKDSISMPLDNVLAYMHVGPKAPTADVNLDPPPIFYSDTPAILVVYLGQPQFKPVKGTQVMFAVNTNWAVLMDMKTSQYYLQYNNSWLTTSDPVKGPWTAARSLPAEFAKLPDTDEWKDVRQAMPGLPLKSAPRVFVSTQPAELIVTAGEPEYSPLFGTRLMYVSNPATPLFLDLLDSNYYYLVSGRWFRAQNIAGPWTPASNDLPAEFAKIPPDSDMGFVLASIPKTQEAQDAVLLASVPHKATITVKDAALDVTYDAEPNLQPVQGTALKYAVNTPYQVVLAEGKYYCCYKAAWFVAPGPKGPWVVCTSVPQVIYTIPASCPVYNVTYVRVYSYTPDVVVVGYTAGYTGQYVAATGTLMFGAGMAVGMALANNWYHANPCFYSYGCAAHYSYSYGGYFRTGGAWYGPHGGAGWGAGYNPATGTWARAGYAYGPAGAHWGAQAYNPFTNTYAAHAGGTNGYQSWGKTAVSQDGKWAQAGHVSGAAGKAGYAANSSGQSVAAARGAGGGTVAKTGNGDIYAGRDGNVYKRSDGQWQKYQGGGNWEDTSWKKPTPYQAPSGGNQNRWSQKESPATLNKDSWARQRSSSFDSERSFGGGGFGGQRSFGGGGGFGGERSFGGGGGFGGGRSFGGRR